MAPIALASFATHQAVILNIDNDKPIPAYKIPILDKAYCIKEVLVSFNKNQQGQLKRTCWLNK